jgi:hypothetical protein
MVGSCGKKERKKERKKENTSLKKMLQITREEKCWKTRKEMEEAIWYYPSG